MEPLKQTMIVAGKHARGHVRRRDFILLGSAAMSGARSSQSGRVASARFSPEKATTRKPGNASRPFNQGSNSWAGLTAVRCESTSTGQE
jgi:hypothetical protein